MANSERSTPDSTSPADGQRRSIAIDAFQEIDQILELIPRLDEDDMKVIRGLALRAQSLLWVLYSSSGLDPEWSSADDDARTLYGHAYINRLEDEARA